VVHPHGLCRRICKYILIREITVFPENSAEGQITPQVEINQRVGKQADKQETKSNGNDAGIDVFECFFLHDRVIHYLLSL